MLETDVSQSLKFFIDTLLGVINDVAPYHQIRAKHDSAPWMRRDILVAAGKCDSGITKQIPFRPIRTIHSSAQLPECLSSYNSRFSEALRNALDQARLLPAFKSWRPPHLSFIQASRTLLHWSREHPRIFTLDLNTLVFARRYRLSVSITLSSTLSIVRPLE